jgi:hypothetical protein
MPPRRSARERRQDRLFRAAGVGVSRPSVANAGSGPAAPYQGPALSRGTGLGATRELVTELVTGPGHDLLAAAGDNPSPPDTRQRTSPQGIKVNADRFGLAAQAGNRRLGAQVWARELDPYDPTSVTMETLLKIRRDPVVALGLHMINAPLINATWEIVCEDAEKKRFLTAAVNEIYVGLMLASLPSIALGAVPLTKQWAYRVPEPKPGEPSGPTWTRKGVLPVIVDRVRQLVPGTAWPDYDPATGAFLGIRQPGVQTGYASQDGTKDLIPPLYALWIMHAAEEVFGDPNGWPLVSNVYRLWWAKQYRLALRDRHVEDHVSPVVIVRYPNGTFVDPDTNRPVHFRDVALQLGMAYRAGEVIALSSESYGDMDALLGNTGSGKAGAPKWDIDVRPAATNVEAFATLEESDDVQMLMGLLIPPQALVNAKGGLGSQAVAETMGEAFWQSQAIRKKQLDEQFNKHVVDPLDRLNFPANTPRARLVTTGFDKRDEALIDGLIRILASRSDVKLPSFLDLGKMAAVRGIPWREQPDDSIYTTSLDVANAQAEAARAQAEAQAEITRINTEVAQVNLESMQISRDAAEDNLDRQRAETAGTLAEAQVAQAVAATMPPPPPATPAERAAAPLEAAVDQQQAAHAAAAAEAAAAAPGAAPGGRPPQTAAEAQLQQATQRAAGRSPAPAAPPVPGAAPAPPAPAGTEEVRVEQELGQLEATTDRAATVADRTRRQSTGP